jgi:hypothetical protein
MLDGHEPTSPEGYRRATRVDVSMEQLKFASIAKRQV